MITANRPNQTAMQLTGRDYISFSAISTYVACPLKYFFRYVAGLPEESVSASLVFGGAIHRAAELHFRELLAGNQPPDLDMLLAEYQMAWKDHDLAGIKFAKDDDINTLGQLADRMLRAFQASDLANPAGSIIGVEEELRATLVPGCPELLGRIDLLVETDDELIVTDLKTSKSRWNEGHVSDSADQLLLYSELVKPLAPKKTLKLQFAVLTKAKVPAVDFHAVPVDRHRVERMKTIVDRVWHAIAAENFYPAPSAMQCSGCGFRDACRAWKG